MGLVSYVRWRLSPAGRTVYRGYALRARGAEERPRVRPPAAAMVPYDQLPKHLRSRAEMAERDRARRPRRPR